MLDGVPSIDSFIPANLINELDQTALNAESRISRVSLFLSLSLSLSLSLEPFRD